MRFLIALIFILSACSSPQIEVPLSNWKNYDLNHLNIYLIDENRVEYLRFVKNGYVVTTIGTKKWVSGPVLEWKYLNSKIVIYETKTKIYDELKLVSASENTLTAIRKSGEISHYKILK